MQFTPIMSSIKNDTHDHDCVDMPTTVEEKLEAAKVYIAECEAKIASLEAEKFRLGRFAGDPEKVKFTQAFSHTIR
jgi:hypothetical protein